MKIKFSVLNQTLTREDFNKVIADSKNYLTAEFTFSADWDNVSKVAQFTKDDETYNVDIIDGACPVPWEVLQGGGNFYVNVFGGDLITVNEYVVYVTKSGLREGQFPSEPTPGYFDEVINTTKGYKDEAEGFAEDSKISADEAKTAKQTAIEKAAEALQSAANALISEQNAKTSEDNAAGSENSANAAMNTAIQAMQDLLAMLGADIATLTNGKLTPSQIPAIAITDTFVVDTQAEMLALICETGDIAVRNDLNETFILQGTDPSVIGDWVKLQVPTDYAATAGHANTADFAENAEKINGHRVVYMTQAQYDNAVKNADTIYMVGD